ncbi:cobalt ECF transporter T component CbiQ [Moorella sulfitireducens (nom. illeg.)]|uniref:cobalt ECF transporter T component CbiQ n=1 Tax=Neomoorella sulfitireducens TaxID=2972948 RepID=UPI0021AC6836|nr:cobalt ECF transporter T component CbiQ [Moorella sulfitireducens]
MFRLDQYAYNNRLQKVHPGEKVAFALVTLLIVLAAPRPLIAALVIVMMAGAATVIAGIPFRFYLKLMLVPFSFLAASATMIALTISHQPQAGLRGVTIWGWTLGVTPEGLYLAARVLLKSLGATACLYFLSLTTPVVDILAVLRRARVPALLLDLITLTYRFIFVLLATVNDTYTAQVSRLGYASLCSSYRSLGQLAASLFIKTYRRSQELFTALTARGYQEELVVLETVYPFSWTFLCLGALFDLFLFFLMLLT